MCRDASNAALLPLARVRADLLADVAPVAPVDVAPVAAIGAVLAEDVATTEPRPATSIALLAGWAVASIDTVGASPYAPAMPTRLARVAAGAPLPPGTDAVVPAEAVGHDLGLPTVQQAAAPGENVRRAGEDLAPATRLAAAGRRLGSRIALLAEAIGRTTLAIRRPRLVLAAADPLADRAPRWLAAELAHAGAETTTIPLADLRGPPAGDALILLGGAEIDRDDPALAALAAAGEVRGRGVALSGVESLAWGRIAGRPALVLPTRPEALLIARLALLAPLLDALAGATPPDDAETRPLVRKLVSRVGLAEIALLTRDGTTWRPLATGDLPWSALAAADAFVELPPESEGLAEGAPLAALPLASPIHRSL